MTTLMDTVRIEAPKRSPVRPASPLDPSWDDGSEIPSSERSVQDRSRNTHWDDGPWAVPLERSSMTTLMDTDRTEAPEGPRSKPAAEVDARRDTPTESRSLERSFEVASRGGYARTVVGRLAYFDEEAQTYMVLTRSGALVRVPLRDITSSRGVPRTGPIVADALSRMSRLRSATTVAPT